MATATFTTIGKPVPRVEGPDKVTGAARYSADIDLPGMLWAVNVLSPHAHARILSIDTSRALAVSGVHAVLTARDIPPKRMGRHLKDQPVLCGDVVRFVGDKVAVVAADTLEAAQEGALRVEVEYEDLPAIFDPVATMQHGAPIIHPDARSYHGFHSEIPADIPNVCGYRAHHQGDVAAGFAAADLVVEHTFTTSLAHQGYIEPHASVVAIAPSSEFRVPGSESDPEPGTRNAELPRERVNVWASNKVPYNMRSELAELIDRPETDVIVQPITVGGDFGSKGGPADAQLAYHIAQRTGRPVKFVASSQEDLTATSHRHPATVTIRSGLTRDGRIVARQARLIYNTGAYGSLKPNADGMLNGSDHFAGPYDIPNLDVEAFAVYTNTPPSGYMRAPGHAQVIFAVEAHTDLLARAVGMDPLDFRLRNLAEIGPGGQESAAPQVLRAAAEAIGWNRSSEFRVSSSEFGEDDAQLGTRSAEPGTRNWLVGRGLALAVRGTGVGEGTADLTVNPDGTVTVLSCMPDNGTGALTVVVQVVAEALGVDVDQVRIVRAPTDALPVDVGSGASRMTNVAGHAALAACDQLREQLAPLAATMLGAETVIWNGSAWVADGRGAVTLPELAVEMIEPGDNAAHARVTLAQTRSPDRGYGAQAAEVRVDPETGEVRLTKMVVAHDVGTIINPLGHQGQIDGGVVQGIGLALSEQLVLDEGRVTNPNLAEYKLPTSQDVPELITVNVPTGGPGPFNAKAIGELPSVPGAGAIANAVADAAGGPITHLPITAERVLATIESQ